MSTLSRNCSIIFSYIFVFVLCAVLAAVSSLEAQRGDRGRGGGGRGSRGGIRGRSGNEEQIKKQRQERAEKQFNDLCETLVLDQGQKKEARKAFDEMQQEKDKFFMEMRSGDLDRSQIQKKFQEVQKAYLDKIEALLNEEQIERFKLMREELEKQAAPMDSRRPGPGGFN
ncbi:MAG TPA: hypothetical protein VM123_15035 [archaeon]|nr:hypothetical protein [archaeon]